MASREIFFWLPVEASAHEFTECVNSLVSRFGQTLLWKFSRSVGHTTAAVQPGKKKSKWNLNTKKIPNLETELLTHSVDIDLVSGFPHFQKD